MKVKIIKVLYHRVYSHDDYDSYTSHVPIYHQGITEWEEVDAEYLDQLTNYKFKEFLLERFSPKDINGKYKFDIIVLIQDPTLQASELVPEYFNEMLLEYKKTEKIIKEKEAELVKKKKLAAKKRKEREVKKLKEALAKMSEEEKLALINND